MNVKIKRLISIMVVSVLLSGIIPVDTQAKTIYPLSRLPGPKNISIGDLDEGYFGSLTRNDLFGDFDLSEEIGFKYSYKSGNGTGSWNWHKFAYEGKVIYIPQTPLRNEFKYNVLQEFDLISGSRVINVNGVQYRVRLLRGHTTSPIPKGENDDDFTIGSEWNRLILPLSDKASSGRWKYPDNVDRDLQNWKTNLTDKELGFDGDGETAYVQGFDYSVSSDYTIGDPLTRRLDGSGSRSQSSSPSRYTGWRPALEVVGSYLKNESFNMEIPIGYQGEINNNSKVNYSLVAEKGSSDVKADIKVMDMKGNIKQSVKGVKPTNKTINIGSRVSGLDKLENHIVSVEVTATSGGDKISKSLFYTTKVVEPSSKEITFDGESIIIDTENISDLKINGTVVQPSSTGNLEVKIDKENIKIVEGEDIKQTINKPENKIKIEAEKNGRPVILLDTTIKSLGNPLHPYNMELEWNKVSGKVMKGESSTKKISSEIGPETDLNKLLNNDSSDINYTLYLVEGTTSLEAIWEQPEYVFKKEGSLPDNIKQGENFNIEVTDKTLADGEYWAILELDPGIKGKVVRLEPQKVIYDNTNPNITIKAVDGK